MGKTITEKIIAEHCGKSVKAGEFAVVNIDVTALQDVTGLLAIEEMEKNGLKCPVNPQRTILFIDHVAPSTGKERSNSHRILREYAKKTGVVLSDTGEGICNQKLVEEYVNPGEILVGADPHSCTSGALGALALGMKAADVGAAMAKGKIGLEVPQTIKINVTGQLSTGVYAKDLILHLIGVIGKDGAKDKVLEFAGETVQQMPMSDRCTLANMAVETGAKAGLIASDAVTRDYLLTKGRGHLFREIYSDPDAVYEKVFDLDVSGLEPTVSCPHSVDNVTTVDKLSNVRVDQVFIGSCTNGRIQDLRVAAQILKDKRVHPDTRLIVIPASKRVFLDALSEGIIKIFVDAGAFIMSSGCGPCAGLHGGILADGEVCLSTQNNNSQGRMGNMDSRIYLCSPATAAISAITGYITDPREVMSESSSQGVYPFERYIS